VADGPVADAAAMVRGMAPVQRPGTWLFVHAPGREDLLPQALASFREDEGLSLILPEAVARAEGFDGTAMACLTLTVWSSLEAVGLTAAVAQALEAEGIPANVVAAFRHDHVFVPAALAARALAALERLAAL
jgi:hypothetical protein